MIIYMIINDRKPSDGFKHNITNQDFTAGIELNQ